MPTWVEAYLFRSDLRQLSREQRKAFLAGVRKFVEDLRAIEEGRQSSFRAGLRVKRYQGGEPGVMEMTWADDGRALWMFGEEQQTGKRHVIWLRVGTHDIFQSL